MKPNYAEPTKPYDKPEKEAPKENIKDKPKSKVKDKPAKVKDKPKPKNVPKPSKSPQNLALGPQKKPSKSPENLKNLALRPKKEDLTPPKEPRNLALGPQKKPSKSPKNLKNLALRPVSSKPLKSPENLALGQQKNSSKISLSPKNLALNRDTNSMKPLKKHRNLAIEPQDNQSKLSKSSINLHIRNEIKKLDWENVSNDWTVKRINSNKRIQIDPNQDCTKDNPLYKNKDWLKRIYNDKKLNLNDQNIGEICGVNGNTIGRWRKNHGIPTKPMGIIKSPKEPTLNPKKSNIEVVEKKKLGPNKIPTNKAPSKTKFQKLFNDGEKKECGKCHEIKLHEEFERRYDSRNGGRYYIRSTCKNCKLENKQIYALKNKYQVIKNLYKGKFKEKCERCNTGKDKLPALEFHHNDPEKKTIEWHELMYKNWKNTLRTLEKEGVKILCRNCHKRESSTTYNKYEEVIQNKKIDLDETNETLRYYVKSQIPNANKSILYDVRKHIKKRAVIDQLYGGKCIGCENITTKNNLPALQFHHRNSENEDKSKLWKNIKSREINEIKTKLKAKHCVSLCANCHRMVHASQFEKNNEEIIGSNHTEVINKYYEKVKKKINNFKFK